MSSRQSILLALCLWLMLMGCSRSKQRSILDTIPATSSVVIHTNADRMLKMAGCDSRNGNITLTSDIKGLLESHPKLLALLASTAGQGSRIDLSNLYAFCYDSVWMITADIRPNATIIQAGNQKKTKALGKVHIAQHDSVCFLHDSRQMWIAYAQPEDMANMVEKAIAGAHEASLSKFKIASQYLDSVHLARVYLAMPLVHNPIGSDFNAMLVSIKGTDRGLQAQAYAMRNGFRVDPLEHLLVPDAAVLQNMPSGTNLSFAIGLGPGIFPQLMPWARQLPLASQLLVNAVSALADPDGGTFALGIAPGGSAETIKHISMDSWIFKAMLPIADKGEDVATLINQVTNDQLYSQSDSAYLDITNYDPEFYPSDDAISLIPGALAQAQLSIGYRSQVMKAFQLKSGYKVEVWAADSTLHAGINLQGPTQYLLPALIRDLNSGISACSWK